MVNYKHPHADETHYIVGTVNTHTRRATCVLPRIQQWKLKLPHCLLIPSLYIIYLFCTLLRRQNSVTLQFRRRLGSSVAASTKIKAVQDTGCRSNFILTCCGDLRRLWATITTTDTRYHTTTTAEEDLSAPTHPPAAIGCLSSSDIDWYSAPVP